MNKHKIIHKFFDHRRTSDDRQTLSDSSEEEPFQLHEVDCNDFFYNQKQDYSLLDFLDTLKADNNECISQQEEQQYRPDIQHYSNQPVCSTLQQINASYLSQMGEAAQQHSFETREGGFRVRFDGLVRAKYFNKQQAVAQVFDAQQYTSFDQYQQSQDVVDQPWQN